MLIYIVNLILLFFIGRYEYNSSSDKSMFITSLFFLVLLVMNLILGFSAQLARKPIYRHYYYAALMLVVVVFVSSAWIM